MTETEERPGAGWGVIFDVDGTMVDNHGFHQRAWIALGRRRGLPIDAEYYMNHIHSKDNAVIMENMRRNFGRDGLDASVAEEKEAIYRELYGPLVDPMPGLARFLGELRALGVPCAVASNAPEPNARMILARLGVEEQFRGVFTPGDGLAGKPAPDLFLAAASAIGLPPERCVVFEDSYSGFIAADAAGMPCVAILRGASPVSLPRAAGVFQRHQDFTTVAAEALARSLDGGM